MYKRFWVHRTTGAWYFSLVDGLWGHFEYYRISASGRENEIVDGLLQFSFARILCIIDIIYGRPFTYVEEALEVIYFDLFYFFSFLDGRKKNKRTFFQNLTEKIFFKTLNIDSNPDQQAWSNCVAIISHLAFWSFTLAPLCNIYTGYSHRKTWHFFSIGPHAPCYRALPVILALAAIEEEIFLLMFTFIRGAVYNENGARLQ